MGDKTQQKGQESSEQRDCGGPPTRCMDSHGQEVAGGSPAYSRQGFGSGQQSLLNADYSSAVPGPTELGICIQLNPHAFSVFSLIPTLRGSQQDLSPRPAILTPSSAQRIAKNS